ncbi:MAG: gamma-glutamyl-gamma-aminobutyrate hydrolase family protein [Phycisphaerales bacterium]
MDCGAKRNILRHLTERVARWSWHRWTRRRRRSAGSSRSGEIDGLFISNGPGDPAAVRETVENLAKVLDPGAGETIPTFGICLGHQLLALAVGAKTYKLPFGHRGANQPVRSEVSGRVEITSQNHGFAVDTESLRAVGGEPTHVHLNDGTLAGFRLKDRPVLAVQFHPEASPGPHDAAGLFDGFVQAMRARRGAAKTVSGS